MASQRSQKAPGAPGASPASQGRGGILQRKCACGTPTPGGATCRRCRKQVLQRRTASGAEPGTAGTQAPSVVYAALGRSGRPLEAPLRPWLEARFQHDFSGVRLHTDGTAAASAQAVGALAYTVGQDVVFGAGAYAPHTPQGLHLLAHELTHVVQQSRQPAPSGEGLAIEPESTAAEAEADRMATAVLTPGPVAAAPSPRPFGLRRSTGWALFGAVVGAAAGALLGALAGPAGAIVGGLAGAALGAWIGGSSSRSKKDDKEGTPLARIHRLLSTGVFDWVVTDEEALQALGILQEVEKRDPVELLDIVQKMKLTGDWETLRRELPPVMRPSLAYYDTRACHPDHGYVMPGDVVHLEFFIPGQPRPLAKDTGDGKDTKAKDTSYEARVSGDYPVDSKGIVLPDLGAVSITGLSLQDAANRVAEAYTDPLWAYEMGVELTPKSRGVRYAGLGTLSAPETAQGMAKTKNQAALAHRDKRADFAALVPWSLSSASRRMELAVGLYYREVDAHLDKYDDPKALWAWAQKEADTRMAAFDKKTPAQAFLEFGQHMMAEASSLPPKEQARTKEAYSRFIAWLDRHEKDPKLASTKPVDIWVKAYMNIVTEEVDQSVHKAMDDLKARRREAAWGKAEEKFGEAIEFAKKHIWPETPTEGISTNQETLSETTGEVVKVGYLIMASPAERIMRDKIASDWLHDILERMQQDPEAFIKTSVKDDFLDYAQNHPEQVKALALTVQHPYVEKQEEKVDIPAWQTATELVVGLIPFVGTGVAIAEVVGGRDLFGHPLTTTERTIIGVGILLPGIFKALKLGREAFIASKVVKEYGLEGAEAARVWKIYTGLGPGSKGARLFEWGVQEIKAGRAVDDPKVLSEMEGVLKDLGMTDKEAAKALAPAAERTQVEAVAREDVQAVKAIVGPISDETEAMLKAKPELAEALKENSLAAIVLKKCNSPCIPEQATAEQVRRLEGILEQIRKTGPYDEEALRTFLYERRAELDKAIAEINVFTGTKNVQGGSAAKDLDAWLAFRNSGGKVTRGVDPALVQAQKNLAHDIGVEAGRKQAGLDGLTLSNFETPFQMGSHGQGLDDIALRGSNWDRDPIFIIEHKGGEAKLAPGQMDTDWVVGNIQRLYREGGTEGKLWAQRLAKALEEGRLRGRAYSTPVVGGAAGTTETIGDWTYKAQKVNLVP